MGGQQGSCSLLDKTTEEEAADPTFVLSRGQNRKFKLNRNQQLKGSGKTSLIGSVSSL